MQRAEVSLKDDDEDSPTEYQERDHFREALEKNITEKGDVITKLRQKIFDALADLEEKDERKVDLNEMFKEKAKEIAITEDALKEEINEVKERLEIL